MHVGGVDGVSQASPHSDTDSLADKGAKLRARPAGCVEQRKGAACAPGLAFVELDGSRLNQETIDKYGYATGCNRVNCNNATVPVGTHGPGRHYTEGPRRTLGHTAGAH